MVQHPQGQPCILAMCQAELDKWQKDGEDLLAAGVKKKNLPKKPVHWAKATSKTVGKLCPPALATCHNKLQLLLECCACQVS